MKTNILLSEVPIADKQMSKLVQKNKKNDFELIHGEWRCFLPEVIQHHFSLLRHLRHGLRMLP